jgi:hypothetical protein
MRLSDNMAENRMRKPLQMGKAAANPLTPFALTY